MFVNIGIENTRIYVRLFGLCLVREAITRFVVEMILCLSSICCCLNGECRQGAFFWIGHSATSPPQTTDVKLRALRSPLLAVTLDDSNCPRIPDGGLSLGQCCPLKKTLNRVHPGKQQRKNLRPHQSGGLSTLISTGSVKIFRSLC